jgi:hypothetical protein
MPLLAFVISKSADFAGRPCRFQLRLGEMAELERLCGAGIGAIFMRQRVVLVAQHQRRGRDPAHAAALQPEADRVPDVPVRG